MTPRLMLFTLVSLVALALCAIPIHAQEGKEMSPEAKAMMEAWEKAATPNENHQRFAGFAGIWNFTSSWWPSPGAPPTESTGTATFEMILGGRYLKETVKARMMGESFEGIGYIGYDNLKKTYISTWMDNMSTGVGVSVGSWDAGTKSFTWHGDYIDAMTGKSVSTRMVDRIESADRHVSEFYETGPDGSENKTMEIIYTRQ